MRKSPRPPTIHNPLGKLILFGIVALPVRHAAHALRYFQVHSSTIAYGLSMRRYGR
jgi:fumarate reductase subunit D